MLVVFLAHKEQRPCKVTERVVGHLVIVVLLVTRTVEISLHGRLFSFPLCF